MALINYVEPTNIGSIFGGLGVFIMLVIMSIVFYRLYIKLVQYIDVVVNREVKYELFEETFLDKIAKEKGIDLNEEMVKRKIYEGVKDNKRKSFRKKIEEKIYEDMFGDDLKKKK